MDKKLGNGRNAFLVIYLLGFLFALHHAIPTYINSSFIEIYTSERIVGILYLIGSILSIVGLTKMPKIMSRFGNYRTVSSLVILAAFLLLGLSYFKDFIYLAPIFVVYLSIIPLIILCLDVFLERFSDNEKTGAIRGSYLSITNAAWVIAPLLGSLILTNSDYWKIYLVAALFLLVFLVILRLNLRDFTDPLYLKISFIETFRIILNKKDVRNIFISNFLLQFFYAWMIIYMPIYLHQYIGLSWKEIGVIFTAMLLPFVLFEFPAGRIADKRLGEKEILTIGFVVTAILTASIFFILSKNVFIWMIVLFGTRVGASMIEVMTESYFFKHTDPNDTNIISAWRRNLPFAFILGPILAIIVLSFLDYKYLFLILGAIMLYGLRYSLALKDTR